MDCVNVKNQEEYVGVDETCTPNWWFNQKLRNSSGEKGNKNI